MSTIEEKYSRITCDCIQDNKRLFAVFTTKTLSRVLNGMTEERLLFRKDWKKTVARDDHSFGEELSH